MRMGKLSFALVTIGSLLGALPAAAQVQERTIRWGHLNNTDHPVSFGVQKFAEILAAKSGGKLKIREFAASQLGNEMQQQSALRGGTQEMLSASTTSLASVVKEFGLFDFPVHRQHVRAGRRARFGAFRQGDDRRAAREGPDRARLLGARLPQRHQQQPSDRQARGLRGAEAARDPEPGLSRDLQGLQGQPGADGVRRTLHRAGEQDRRRPGESLQRHPVQQVLRSSEIRLGDQPHLHAEHHHRQQEVLGSRSRPTSRR